MASWVLWVSSPVKAARNFIGIFDHLIDEVAEMQDETEALVLGRTLILPEHPPVGVLRPLIDTLAGHEREADGARIGVVRQYVDVETGDPQVKALMEKAIADLKAQGAEIVDPFVIPDYDKLTEKLGCGDFQKDLNTYLAEHAPTAYYKSLSDIVESGLYLPYIEAQMKRNVAPKTEAQLSRGPCVDTYHDPKKIAFRDAVLGEMEKDHVDALIYPTWSNPPRKVGDMKSPAGDNSQVLSPQTGFPAITVPMGFTYDSLPAGLTFVGRSFSEGLLIKYAYGYEQATKHRRPPAGFGSVE